LLTVIIPAFNCSGTIHDTVASVVRGNADVVSSIVIVDDGSNDDTLRHLQGCDTAGVPLTLLTHATNRGGAAARNTAMTAVTTEFAFCLDSDNVLAPHSLHSLYNFAVATDADVASFRELHYFKQHPNAVTHKWRFKEGAISLGDYLAGAVVPGASGNYLFKRSVWKDVGGYPEGNFLDTWGFGLRTVATGKAMLVMPRGHYFHRYGHESYWVREHRPSKTSLLARQLLAPFESQLHPDAVTYLDEHPDDWFEHLDRRPPAAGAFLAAS
jgi:glycosyltransferase involved in cell wall biosynthesis